MKKIGYLRVSTEEQRPDRQIDGLDPICDEIHIERLSAVAKKRPIFETVMGKLETGDTLVVWDLDRAFRSTVDAFLQAEKLRKRGIQFRIVTLDVDTSEPVGQFFYTIMAAYAQFERQNVSRRTKEGLEAARKRGTRLGRPPKLDFKDIQAITKLIETKQEDLVSLARLYEVHPSTISRAINRYNSI